MPFGLGKKKGAPIGNKNAKGHHKGSFGTAFLAGTHSPVAVGMHSYYNAKSGKKANLMGHMAGSATATGLGVATKLALARGAGVEVSAGELAGSAAAAAGMTAGATLYAHNVGKSMGSIRKRRK